MRLEDVFKFYYYSPKKYRHLQKVADIFGTVIEHFGGLKNLRWCASQQRSWAALYNNYTTVVEHLSEMGNAYAQFKLEDREQARNLRDRLVKSKFVMCMHLMNDILQVVGEVSVQMQDPVCTILDIPGFYETLRTITFAVKQCTTPKSLQETVLEIFFHLKRFVALEMNGLVSKCTLSNKLLKSDHQCNCISIFSSQNITNPNPSSNIFGFFLSLYYVSACQPLLWKGCFLY